MSDVLTKINNDKREHIAACKAATPLSALEARAKDWDPANAIITVCAVGRDSMEAAAALRGCIRSRPGSGRPQGSAGRCHRECNTSFRRR